MKYGLSEKQLNEIIAILSTFTEIEEAILFGSRAIDTYKEASDVDIALKGDKVTASLAAKLKYQFEEDTYLPFFFDFVAYTTITNEALKEHIDTKGVLIYRAGWRECKLGDVADVQTGPFGSQLHSSDYIPKGIPSIMPTNIGNRLEINRNNIACIKDSDAKRLERYLVKEGDVVYSRRGDVEKCAFITGNESGWLCGTGCLRIRFKRDKVIPKYCAYFLSTDEIKGWVSGHAVGTTMPNLNSAILSNVPIVLPPLSEQHAIASVLSSLDDKIDLLHRQNKTLEAMAETLFRQWFVPAIAGEPHAGGVEAKGDWEEGKIPDEFDFVMGASPPGESYNEDGKGTPMFQGNADFGFRFPQKRVFTTNPKRFAEKYDTLISVRAPVGAQNMAYEKCCIGRGVAAFRYKRENSYYTYTYFRLKSLMEEIKQFNETGTVFGSISKGDFEVFEIVVPPIDLVDKFQVEVKPIDDKVISNCIQICILEKLRDTLLTKLMSGEVRVEYGSR